MHDAAIWPELACYIAIFMSLSLQDAELIIISEGHDTSSSNNSSSSIDQNLYSTQVTSPGSINSHPASPMTSHKTYTAPSLVSPVKIPTHWHPDTLSKNHFLVTIATRTLISIMMSKVGAKPTRGQCKQVARDWS